MSFTQPFTVRVPVSAPAVATVEVLPPRQARQVTLRGGDMIFGDVLPLAASTNGDGIGRFSILQGPGVLTGATLSASGVGRIRVRVDFPETTQFDAGSAEAWVQVHPKPVTFTLQDQDADFDGSPKTAAFTVSDPGALAAGMIDVSQLTRGPDAGAYPVAVSASGNYVGSASATLRILPVIEWFSVMRPPNPRIESFEGPAQAEWPSRAVLHWRVEQSGEIRLRDESGGQVAAQAAGSFTAPVLDARNAAYTYTLEAAPLPGILSMAQRGGTQVRLLGPNLDLDAQGLSSRAITDSGSYTYVASAGSVSRSLTLVYAAPPSAEQRLGVQVEPARVSPDWPDRLVDGPYTLKDSDLPQWRLGSGAPAVGETRLTWSRSDDHAHGALPREGVLMPGHYRLRAEFVPSSPNLRAATAESSWSITAPLTLTANRADLRVEGVPTPAGALFRLLPGATLSVQAVPWPDHAWGDTWNEAGIQIWTGTPGLAADPGNPRTLLRIPAGVPHLTLTATAYQLAPRLTELTPVESSYTVSTGAAQGRTYPRVWGSPGRWNAYLGRDGVTVRASGVSRESGIAEFELEAKAPGYDWASLRRTIVDSGSPNGPRTPVQQVFSLKLGDCCPDRPLVPSDPSLAGTWQVRARVRSTAGTWSDWSAPEPLNVVLPLQTVELTGRTLPPVQDAAWFLPSQSRRYTLSVWVP